MRSFIDKEISQAKSKYRSNYSEAVRDYNLECETIKGYNGRQLLELLQNCDDEGSKQVMIRLNTDEKEISIHNNGSTFSKKGYRSLFLSNLSSKTNRKQYIGNKGLGFRSIINWSNSIEIQSNNISLKYSEENRKYRYDKLFDLQTREKICKEEEVSKDIVLFPFLTLPDVQEVEQTDFKTSIIIKYKEESYLNILDQVRSITSETLLFLNSIETIIFEGFNEDIENIYTKKEEINNDLFAFGPSHKIISKDTNWYIFEDEGSFKEAKTDEDKNNFYQIKIAIEENLSKTNSKLFSFFPTNIELDQPYILHATFELDSTRNQLIDSDKNIEILERVVKFTVKVSKYFAKGEVSYKPLEILNHRHKADTLNNLGYYDFVEKAINTEAILPCIDNKYRTIEDSIYVSDDFGRMLQEVGAADLIDIHILPLESRNLRELNLEGKIDYSIEVIRDVIDIINEISKLDLTISQRAFFISQIVEECDFIKSEYKNQINFLEDKDNVIVDGLEYIYTPATKNNKLRYPSFTKIHFISENLYNELLKYFDYESNDGDNKGRFISDKLDGFSQTYSYEPVKLAQKIISETKILVKKDRSRALEYIQEMNDCLFYNYKIYEDNTKLLDSITIPTITKNGKIANIDTLMLSDYYPTGKNTEIIFDGIYTDDDYIGSPEDLGLDNIEESIEGIENFLKWLGVNEYAQYIKKDYENTGADDYWKYVKSIKEGYIDNRYKTKILKIKNFDEILKEIEIEKLILWAYFDKRFKNKLNDITHGDSFYYFYYSYNKVSAPSYIKYKISTLFPFNINEYLVDDKYSWVNDFDVDYGKQYFVENEITKTFINEILVSFGAKDSFNSLSIDRIAYILNTLPEKYPDGRKTQSIYKKALDHYKVNNEELPNKVCLFADDGIGLKVYSQEEIYFSDKIKLPKQLKNKYPIFNFPSRAGGNEAIKFFQINNLSDIHIKLVGANVNEIYTNSFDDILKQKKSLILTTRLNSIEEENVRKQQASICNKISIVLCNELKYKIDKDIFDASEYEYVHNGDSTYYLKINKEISFENIVNNKFFVKSCADIVALSFDVRSEKNEYKHIFRSDFDDVLIDITDDFGVDTYNDARELLGLSDYKQAFWLAVFQSINIDYLPLDDEALELKIEELFGINFSVNTIDYESINDVNEVVKIKRLFHDIAVDLNIFIKFYSYKFDLIDIHKGKIKSKILSSKLALKSALWLRLKDKTIEEKSNYLREINLFENYHEYAEKVAEQYKHQFDLPLNIVLQEYINSLYENLIVDENRILDLFKLKRKNAKQFSRDELHVIEQNERFKSLLYFEDVLDVIKKELEFAASNKEPLPLDNKSPIIIPRLRNSDTLNYGKKSGSNSHRGGVYTPSERNARLLKEKGNSSEDIVYDYLILNNYKNVDHVAKDNEGLYCDIRYTDNNGSIKFVEVKTFDNGMFFLTKSEYEFGKSEQENYEIWLVRNKEDIIPITDFYTNEKYKPIISEYQVYLKIK